MRAHEEQLSGLVVFSTAATFLAMEQRMNTKFCSKLGKTPTEIYEMLQNVCGEESLSRSGEFEWFKRSKDGSENLQSDPSSGVLQPLEMQTVANVREMVTRDSRRALRMMADE
jgi:hypothetical protein